MGEVLALSAREVKKWVRSKFIILLMLVQPVAWLGLYGKAFRLTSIASIPPELAAELPPALRTSIAEVFNRSLRGMFGGTTDYFTYMAAGMLSIIILFTAMFSGMSTVWDRKIGFLKKLLVAPIWRGSIILSKMISSVLRGVFQATLVFGIAALFGLQIGDAFNLLDLLGLFAALLLLSVGFSAIFVSLSIRVTHWETQTALANLLNLPLVFASNALFPISQMPDWLQTAARINPITYATDAVRSLIMHSTELPLNTATLAQDFQVLALFAFTTASLGMFVASRGLQS